jgi:AcrR family transcriptional regulator
MGRWEPDTRVRLEQAAFGLFEERGFERTTVAEIAQRAGLTERTFFRHFADKREVLFGGGEYLKELFARRVAEAPAGASPMEAVVAALDEAATLIQGRKPFAVQRHAIISAHPDLRERELIKLAALATALADALRLRGVDDAAANLAAEAGIAIFKLAFARWLEADDELTFPQVVRESVGGLRAVLAGG